MRQHTLRILLACMALLPPGILAAQEKPNREIEIHTNVRMVEIAPDANFPEALKQRFLSFLPMFEAVAKENTSARTPECALTIQVAPIIKAVTFGKEEQRVKAVVTIFRKGSSRELIGELFLHDYISGELVNKEDTSKFINRLLALPSKCPPD